MGDIYKHANCDLHKAALKNCVYTVRYTSDALKALRRMPRNMAELIQKKIADLALDPAHARNVKPLKGRPGYRLRVGDWRIVYDVQTDVLTLIVIEIGPRGSIYD